MCGKAHPEFQPSSSVPQKKGKTAASIEGRGTEKDPTAGTPPHLHPATSPSGQLEILDLVVTGWEGVPRNRREM